jgi:hypothetical protein
VKKEEKEERMMQLRPQLGRSLVPVGLIALVEVFVLLLTAYRACHPC